MFSLPTAVGAALVIIGAFGLGGLAATAGILGKTAKGSITRWIAGGMASIMMAVGLLGSGQITRLDTADSNGLSNSAGGNEAALGVEGGTGETAGSATTGTQSGSGSRSTTSRTGGGSGSGGSGGSGDAPGVTATTVKLGFSYATDTDAFAGSVGSALPDQGSEEDAINAIVKYVNSNGGLGGRNIVPVIRTTQLTSTDPNQLQSVCNQFTQEDRVFAVIGANAPLDCYAKAHTIAFEGGILGQGTDTEDFAAYSPFAWRNASATIDQGGATAIDGLANAGFFGPGSKVGVVAYDNAPGHRTYNNHMAPRVARLGFPSQVRYVSGIRSFSDIGNTVQQIQAAAVQFCLDGVNRVFFLVPGGLAALVFAQQAKSQECHPRYGYTSFDHPGDSTESGNWSNIESELPGSMGVGWRPVGDVASSRAGVWPSGDAEKKCHQVFKDAGLEASARANAQLQVALCDTVFLLQAGSVPFRTPGSLTVQSWAGSVERLGPSFQNAENVVGGTSFVQGRKTGTYYFRVFRYENGCGCFEYSSGNNPLSF